MPITELVFMTAKPDPHVRKELDIKLPDALSGVFSNVPQLESLYIGTSLEATEDGSSQDGICLLLKWQDISGFDSLIESPKFAAFKASIFPYFIGPPDIQLYESPEGMPARIAVDSPFLHIMKSHPEAADDQSGQPNRTSVEGQWKAFIEQCRLAPSASRSLQSSFNGFGLRKDNGAFLGATIWKDQESIDSTLNNSVKQHVQQLQKVVGTGDWVHFALKIEQVALDK